MNSEHLQLREDPFGTSPDPRFLYEAESHSQAAATLITNLDNGVRVQVFVSAPGLGKTTLLHSLMECACRSVNTVFIEDAKLEAAEFLAIMIESVGGELPAGKEQLLGSLIACLLNSPNGNLLIIDNAQDLDPSILELLNQVIEATRRKLQVVMSGDNELPRNLKRTSYSLLRIARIVELKPLQASEISGYVAFRLYAVGYEGPPIFSDEAARLIYERSSGVPRLINQLCSEALDVATVHETEVVDRVLMERVFPKHDRRPFEFNRPESSIVERAVDYWEPERDEPNVFCEDFTGLVKAWLLDHATMWSGTAAELATQLRTHSRRQSTLSQSVTSLNVTGMVEVNIERLRRVGVEAKISAGLPRLITLRVLPALSDELPSGCVPGVRPLSLGESDQSQNKEEDLRRSKTAALDSLTEPTFSAEELAAVDDLLARFVDSATDAHSSAQVTEEPNDQESHSDLRSATAVPPMGERYRLPTRVLRSAPTLPTARTARSISPLGSGTPQRTSPIAFAPAFGTQPAQRLSATNSDSNGKLVTLPASIPAQSARVTTIGMFGVVTVIGVLFLVGFLTISFSALSANQPSDTNNANFTLPVESTARDLNNVAPAQLLSLAKSGDAGAQYELGRRYSNGIGTRRDNKQALKWLRKSAEWGNGEAQFQLARMLAKSGELPEAYTWLVLASRNGKQNAKEESNLLAAKLSGEQLAFARFQTGQRFSEGLGVSRDYPTAYAWFRLASAAGSQEALERMGTLKLRLKPKDMEEVQREYSAWLVTQLR